MWGVGVAVLGSILILVATELLAVYVCRTRLALWLTIGAGILVFLVAIGFAIAVSIRTGSFECANCHKRFRPSAAAFIIGPHIFSTRMLKCPHCGHTTWCKYSMTAEPDPIANSNT